MALKRIYIGLPEFNYPAFHAAAAVLRAQGHHVENPQQAVAHGRALCVVSLPDNGLRLPLNTGWLAGAARAAPVSSMSWRGISTWWCRTLRIRSALTLNRLNAACVQSKRWESWMR